ncbi:LacI family DNA-binding transcriptional regulator [Glutamicibacter protophormiae]|uniref:LacI family DNA-binding transcriptional regulator n=1 Tax=Glutamicibacter protophormiae TaxID=37930 RepID=UPI003A921C9D
MVVTKQVGIKDVAVAAGVSVTTVSHVLNDVPNTRASEQTRDRVKAAATALGYRPNRLARSLRTQMSEMVGLVTEEIATTPHAGQIILGAQEAASKRDLVLTIINARLNPRPRVGADEIRALIERQVDGVIYATVFHDVVSLPKEMNSVPSVLIGAQDRAGRIPSVVPDERGGAASVVEMLAASGHLRIGFLASAVDVPATRGRYAGYCEAMAAAGLTAEEMVVAAEPEASGGYLAAGQLLAREPAQRPTAMFCYNDRMAVGAYRAASECGLRIPDDVSIVGFDDQAPIPESLFPALTTVTLPHYDMGAWAVNTLAEMMVERKQPERVSSYPVQLPCPIAARGSVAPPHSAGGHSRTPRFNGEVD